MTDIGQTLLASLNNGLAAVVSFIPKFFAGVIILILGFVVASIVKQIVIQIIKALRVEALLKKYSVPEGKEEFNWANILAEIVRWFIIIIFLIPTADVWGLPQIVTVLNTFLLYLPNVFVAAIIGLVGFVFAQLAYDIMLASTKSISSNTSKTIASFTKWAITVFVILAILTQLGVAADLVRILFTGLVAMLAIAGGIAFGLGGKDSAKSVIEEVHKKLK
ncbi:MAG: hypothetical protein M1268_03080 [Patescibacteria group bacterium]|nr:hypothetical protein [Patescibacteria group bacterium]